MEVLGNEMCFGGGGGKDITSFKASHLLVVSTLFFLVRLASLPYWQSVFFAKEEDGESI